MFQNQQNLFQNLQNLNVHGIRGFSIWGILPIFAKELLFVIEQKT